MATFRDIVISNQHTLRSNGNAFQSTFGVPLSRFWNNLCGFDVVAFNDYLQCPENVSLADHITQKYGNEACNLVEVLIR